MVVDQLKIEATLKWPTLKTLRELRGFLGLTGYYRKFVASYSKIAWPLTEQLKKNNFGWNEATEEPFQRLKTAKTINMVLEPGLVGGLGFELPLCNLFLIC